eukprot:9481223-Pyramimonas_sp.AAC.1
MQLAVGEAVHSAATSAPRHQTRREHADGLAPEVGTQTLQPLILPLRMQLSGSTLLRPPSLSALKERPAASSQPRLIAEDPNLPRFPRAGSDCLPGDWELQTRETFSKATKPPGICFTAGRREEALVTMQPGHMNEYIWPISRRRRCRLRKSKHPWTPDQSNNNAHRPRNRIEGAQCMNVDKGGSHTAASYDPKRTMHGGRDNPRGKRTWPSGTQLNTHVGPPR